MSENLEKLKIETQKIEKLKYDNDQMLLQLGWLLERVVVKNGQVEIPGRELNSKDILDSLNELKKIVCDVEST